MTAEEQRRIHEANQRRASECLGRLVRLIGNADFRWFLRECAAKEMARLDEIIHSRTQPQARREEALSEWIAVKQVIEWPERVANDHGKTLGHAHRITLDITEPTTNSETTQPPP